MLAQSSTGRIYTRDAYAPVRRDAHAEVEKINGLSIFSNFEEFVVDRSVGISPPAPIPRAFGVGAWDGPLAAFCLIRRGTPGQYRSAAVN
jgi:hypothetical protein